MTNLGIYRLVESTVTFQIGLYHTTNDLKLYIPVCNEILCEVILFEFTVSSKIANK